MGDGLSGIGYRVSGIAGLLALIGLLAACASSVPAPTATPLPSATSAPAPTALPSATPVATATPVPSATPLPSATAVPSAMPVPTATLLPPEPQFGFPIGRPGQVPGYGFFIRHGYAVENTWFNPGYWHAGEDWYAVEGDTAGAEIYAVAAGEVVYAGSNYPGRVVIVRHSEELYSMYGHLDPALAVAEGAPVARGDLLGSVLRRGDDVPNHLHFELRTFLTTREVNGAAPRYGFRCGLNCPPGPGYWPINAPDHPSAQGWRNPSHVIAGRMFPADYSGAPGAVIVPPGAPSSLTLRNAPAADAAELLTMDIAEGQHFMLLEVRAGPEASEGTAASAYSLWYRIAVPDGLVGWVSALAVSDFETGSDGRAATLYWQLLPDQERGGSAAAQNQERGSHAAARR